MAKGYVDERLDRQGQTVERIVQQKTPGPREREVQDESAEGGQPGGRGGGGRTFIAD